MSKTIIQNITDTVRSLLGEETTGAPLIDKVYPDDVYLVSYPRSGNSFLQHLICNYLHPQGFESTYSIIPDLHMNPELASDLDRPRIIKSHEAAPQPYPNVVYIARDGRDVAISYHAFLKRNGQIPDDLGLVEFVAAFNDGEFGYGRWSDHVMNWLDAHHDALVVRYEDMLADGERELRRVLEFLDRPVDEDRLADAVEKSQFGRLQKREKERVNASGEPEEENLFFRKGKKRQWESKFSDEMNDRFIRRNRKALKRLNYVDV